MSTPRYQDISSWEIWLRIIPSKKLTMCTMDEKATMLQTCQKYHAIGLQNMVEQFVAHDVPNGHKTMTTNHWQKGAESQPVAGIMCPQNPRM